MNRQHRRVLAAAALGVLAGILCGCGGRVSLSQAISASGNNTTVFVTDAAADKVLAFRLDVTAASLVDSTGHSVNAAGMPRHLELRHLELAPAILFQANLPPANYTTLNLTVANVEVDVASSGTTVQTFNAFTSPGVSISKANITLPMTVSVAGNSVPGLMVDFDLRSSLTTDTSGNYTFNPVVQVTPVASTTPGWQLAGARGEVVSVNGSTIHLQLYDGGFAVPVQVNSNTQFSSDLQGITGLSAGQAVEISAHFANGTYTADAIDSDVNPAVSKRGVVIGGPTTLGTPVTLVVQE